MKTEDRHFFNFLKEEGGSVSKFRILLVVEALLLFSALFQYTVPLHKYTYQGSGLSGAFCRHMEYLEGYGEGCYLDRSLVTDETVDATLLYMATPMVDLPKGSYQVSVAYATDDPDQKYAFTSKNRTYPVITGNDGNRIPVGEHTLQLSFFSPVKVDEFEVHLNYSGSGYLFVERVDIHETNAWKNMFLFYVLLISLAVDGIIFWHRKLPADRRRKARVSVVVIGFLTVYASVPLLTFFMPQGVDLLFHTNRIEAIKDSILAGQFPNRVSPFWNNGYGYASAVFYGEIFLYVPALLRVIGFSVQGAYKFYVVMVNLATALIAYYCFRKVFKDNGAALAGCMVYVLAPVRLVCIYLRAAVGEYTAMAFFPLIFYGLFQIYEKDPEGNDYKNSFIPLVIGVTGLLQCHLISSLLAGMFIGLFCVVFIKKTFCPPRMGQLIKAGIGTVLLNLWFLLPFVDYFRLGYTNTANEFTKPGKLNSYGTFLNQMVTFFQDGMGSAYTVAERMSRTDERNYALGGFILVVFLYVLFRAYQGKEKSVVSRVGDCCLVFAGIGTFACTVWFPWDFIQQLNGLFRMVTKNIQFPWRFLGITCFFFAVVTVCLMALLQSSKNRPLYYTVIAVVCSFFVISADDYMHNYTENATIHRNVDGSRLDTCNVGAGEYIPADTPEGFAQSRDSAPGDWLEVSEEWCEEGVHTVSCSNPSDADTYIDFPLLPYKGYTCRDQETGERLEVQLSTPGKVRVVVPSGYGGTFSVKYEEPWYWRVSEAVSALVLAGGIVGMAAGRRKRKGVAWEE